MKKNQNHLYLFTAIVFLLLIQLKPIHNFSHLFDSTHSTSIESNDNNENFSAIDYCEICDYNLSPTLEVIVYNDSKAIFSEFDIKLILSKTNSFYSKYYSKNKQLRAPPVHV